jgi:cytochrome c oxidase accessory protein FixG
LFTEIYHFTAPLSVYLWIGGLAVSTYVMAGFAREQVCTYMCPWPRLQSVMMDDNTFNVMYKYDRGEPRAPHKKNESWAGRGDCIQCRQCVVVCPMGIDIRDGLQLECIGCALCIDACDNVMVQIGRPKGLIAYDTLANFDSRKLGKKEDTKIIRTRTVIYSLIICAISFGMLYSLLNRSELNFNVIRDRNPLFVTLSSGDIRNGYTLRILNKSTEDHQYSINISGVDNLLIDVIGLKTRTADNMPLVTIKREEVRTLKIYLSVPRDDIKSHTMDIKFLIKQINGSEEDKENSSFKGPRT